MDLAVRKGTVLGLLGPNGAGKTTAVRILATLLRADTGTARVNGLDVRTQAGQVRENIGLTGPEICADPRRVEALLRDLAGEHRREIFLLVGAAREGVPTELLTSTGTTPAPLITERLVRSLEENLGTDTAPLIPGLALLLARLGRWPEAIAAAEQAQRGYSQLSGLPRSRAVTGIVQALAQAGQTDQALALACQAIEVIQNDHAQCLVAIAAALAGNEEPERAAALLDEAFAATGHAQNREGFYGLLCDIVPSHPGLLQAWLPGEGETNLLVRELADVEAWWRA